MNIRKISIGLLFLMLALVIVPGASAYQTYKTDNTPHFTTAAPGCAGGCHNMPVFCTKCHADPSLLTTITVTPATATVVKGNTQTFAAAPKDKFGAPIAATIAWTSSNTAVGTISATGVLTAVSAATTTVTASNGSIKGTASVTVTSPAVVPVLTTITVSPTSVTIIAGATQTFTATPKDQNLNNIATTITWTSNNTTVGNVDASGKFTAFTAGTTTIKAANGSINGTSIATVTVTASTYTPVLTKINVTPVTSNLKVGNKKSFLANAYDQIGNAMTVIFSWTSSNPTVGTIDSNGNFTGLSKGTTTITASNGSINGSASVTVSANKSKNHDKDEDVSEDESDEVNEHEENELDDESDDKVSEHNSNTQNEHKDKVTESSRQHEDKNKVTENKHTESGSNNPVSVSKKKHD